MNKAQLYMIIKNEFAEKKARKEAIAFENLQNVMKDEMFHKLFREERALIFDIAKYKNAKKDTKELEEALKNIQKQKQERLNALHVSQEWLLPNYDCNICKDSGVVYGKTCKCFDKRLKEKLIEQSSNNISQMHTFSDYNAKIAKSQKHQEQLTKLSEYMKAWVENNSNNKPKLICLSGKTGVGKTFLTECTATHALKNRKLVSMISAFAMNNLFLKYHTSKAEEKMSAMDSLMDPDLLIIDDLGTEPILNNVTVEYLYLIISERLTQNKSTIISTNLCPDGILSRYGERIFSRIFNKRECKSFQILGDDLRICK